MPNKKVKRRYSKWSTDEINVIRNTSLSHRRVADAIGRTYAAVKKKRQDLGIVVKVSDIDYYSDTEIQYIKNNRHLSNPDLARLMGRSVKGLSLKRRHLRLNPPDITWSEKEVKYLLENYAIKSKKKVAEHLKRPLSSVIDKARRLGITRRQQYWTAEEINILMDNIQLPNKELVLLFSNKTIEQIAYKKTFMRSRLLKKKKKKTPFKFRSKLATFIKDMNNMSVGESFRYLVKEKETIYSAKNHFPTKKFITTKISDEERMIIRVL